MKKDTYITMDERVKCQKVAEAFEELYEVTDIAVVNVGKYGFVKLEFYSRDGGFDSIQTYTNSRDLFERLWGDWLYYQLLTIFLGTPTAELTPEKMFKCLPEEKQEELMAKRTYFIEKIGEDCI